MFDLIYPSTTAPILPFPPMDKSEIKNAEMLPVIDESGLVKGRATRADCHAGLGLLHPVVHLYILDRNGRIFMQKRAMSKESWPGRWDTSVGGHVAFGESIREALYRESEEELKFIQYNPYFLGIHVYECENEKELVSTFAAVGNFKINAFGEEVEEGRYWTKQEIANNFNKDIFTPNFKTEYSRIISHLEALL